MIEIKNLTRYYGSKKALNNVSFEIEKGDTVGILGPNGSGKTTLINIILGMLKPDEGSVFYDSVNLTADTSRILSNVGAVVEIPRLYPQLSGTDNLLVFANFLNIPNRKEKITELLSLVGLSDAGSVPFKNYSLGMKQRLGIALSLLNDPEILVFDEPTNGLDPEGIMKVREIIQKLSATGKTVILCSHLISEVELVCKKIVILRNGDLRKLISSKELEGRENLFYISISDENFTRLEDYCENEPSIEIIESSRNNSSIKVKWNQESDASVLLKKMVDANLPVNGFYKEQIPLEDLFLEAVK
ncbi:ABC transporter ATP-binding protein [Leptospira sp. GIMC2001]|uniref:ABC transporter ATP-binding protein n=1 Tax=Leptospira sp. GIMC2001 TaxID=1513297 RepID=UPI00234B964F|nr:ATP-binding cassette domain-containing protein [Leptospira sp. GIMC2001]WCL50190.1 ATP-binding cassette domain-containing protein [Leptospira sp. GIMC2001]